MDLEREFRIFSERLRKNDPELGNEPFTNTLPTLLEVLGSPRPELRDRLGWATLSDYFRGPICPASVRVKLLGILGSDRFLFYKVNHGESAESVRRSFASLTIADLLLGDRTHGHLLGSDDLGKAVAKACDYLSNERDMRGFDTEMGWIHAIAHAGDCLDALISHPEIRNQEIQSCLRSILRYITTRGSLVFNWGEEHRLGRPMASAMSRLSDEALDLVFFSHYPRSKLYEMPALQNLLNTWRCAYLELHWEGSNRTNAMRALQQLIR